MSIYKLVPQDYLKANKKRISVVCFIMFIMFLLVMYVISSQENNSVYDTSTLVAEYTAYAIASIVFFTVFLKAIFKLLKKGWLSYELHIDSDKLIQKQNHLRDITINREEIADIIEEKNKGIYINTKEKNKTVFIPLNLDGYKEVRKILVEWKGINEKVDKISSYTLKNIYTVLSILILIIVLTLRNKYVVIPLGIIYIMIFIYNLIELKSSSEFDERTVKMHLPKMYLIVLIVIAKMITLLLFY